MAFRLAVLVSGSGSNLQAIIDKLHATDSGVEVALVISNVPGVLALDRARAANIPCEVFGLGAYPDRAARDQAMAGAIEAAGCDLVVLAGYMHILTSAFLNRFPYRIINLHPALLPSFPGTHAIQEAVEYGVKVTGVTVHFVDEGVDSGPIIAQRPIDVLDDDTADSLALRIHAAEHEVLPWVIAMIAGGRVTPPQPGSRRVRIESDPSSLDLTLTE